MTRCDWLAATMVAAVLALSAPAHAQQKLARNFPQNALRGTIVFGAPPAIELNGHDAQLAPGARIKTADNLLALTGTVAGNKAVVNYTVEQITGLVKDVWILRPEEIANKPWPRNAEEASEWRFDPVTQTWTKP
jgi:hypothetical protein